MLIAATDELFCTVNNAAGSASRKLPDVELNFQRKDILTVHIELVDHSKGFLDMVVAAGGGGGLDYFHQPTEFFGVKLGGAFTLDLQYDRIQGNSGFSTEGSALIPLFRVPPIQKYLIPGMKQDRDRKFLKLYAEPGVGYRAGNGSYGGYSSAKVMVALLSDAWKGNASPYVEFQRRFPFGSPMQGDNRVAIGVMIAICGQCGME